MKVKLEITENQARLVMNALELYTRIGIGQFGYIKNHPTIEKFIWDNHRDEFHDFGDTELLSARNKLFDLDMGLNGSYGIHSKKVDDSVRVSHDLVQVIRHEFWKLNPERSNITVDSSIHFTSEIGESLKIKCEIIAE